MFFFSLTLCLLDILSLHILSLRMFCPSVCFVPGRYVSGRFVWVSYTSTLTYIYRRRPPIYIYSTHLCCSGRFIHYRYWTFHDDLGYRVVPTKFGLFVWKHQVYLSLSIRQPELYRTSPSTLNQGNTERPQVLRWLELQTSLQSVFSSFSITKKTKIIRWFKSDSSADRIWDVTYILKKFCQDLLDYAKRLVSEYSRTYCTDAVRRSWGFAS
jgi:hypothetical protein